MRKQVVSNRSLREAEEKGMCFVPVPKPLAEETLKALRSAQKRADGKDLLMLDWLSTLIWQSCSSAK